MAEHFFIYYQKQITALVQVINNAFLNTEKIYKKVAVEEKVKMKLW